MRSRNGSLNSKLSSLSVQNRRHGEYCNRMASLTFEELSADPKRIEDLTVNEVSAMLVRVSALSMALSARLASAAWRSAEVPR